MSQPLISLFIRINSWLERNFRIITIWALALGVFVIFESKISSLISSYFIVGEDEIKSRYFDVVFTAIFIVIFLIFIWYVIKNYRISKTLNSWMIFIAIGYYILRTNTTDSLEFFLLKNENLSKQLYYADLFLLLGGLAILLFIRNLFGDFSFFDKFKNKLHKLLYVSERGSSTVYEEDLPIDGSITTDNDKIVNTLANKIGELYTSKAFIIGVNGEWGNGKTTFLKRLEYKLKYEDVGRNKLPIMFWFNTWQHQDDKLIINNFFEQFKKELSCYSGEAKRSVNRYLGRLFAVIDNRLSKGLEILSDDFLKNNATLADNYKGINDLISIIDRRIIVFVDDLDRLNKTEIIEVLRILRNVANFSNTIFICGFDKNYVVEVGGFQKNYLDKIFNLEINLPKLHQSGLLIFLKSLLDSKDGVLLNKEKITVEFNSLFDIDSNESFLDININDLLDDSGNQNINSQEYYYIPLSPSLFFETRRDVKRFYNSLITELFIIENTEDVDLADYLLFKLLVFKFSWILNHFDNKRIDLWLGDGAVLKFDLEKAYFLKTQNDLEHINKLTIYTVLNQLFPNNSKTNLKESSRKINQRRYLPLYLNNNVFNQSFSYSELLIAHKESKVTELIESKIVNHENESYLLNDIKNFILRDENLSTLKEFKHVVEIINTHLKSRVSDLELIHLIRIGEAFDEFKPMADEIIFKKIDDVFGEFLRLLNMNYTRKPNDKSLAREDIGNYLSRNNIKELQVVNQDYVKDKIVELYGNYIVNAESIEEVSRVHFDCTEAHYPFFNLFLYYDEVNESYKKFLKNNFRDIFIERTPEEFLKLMATDFIASVFISSSGKKQIENKALTLLEKRDSWSEDQLDLFDFMSEGWNNFLKFFENISQDFDANQEDKKVINKFDSYIYSFIKKGFKVPTEKEVTLDEAIRRMSEVDKNEEA